MSLCVVACPQQLPLATPKNHFSVSESCFLLRCTQSFLQCALSSCWVPHSCNCLAFLKLLLSRWLIVTQTGWRAKRWHRAKRSLGSRLLFKIICVVFLAFKKFLFYMVVICDNMHYICCYRCRVLLQAKAYYLNIENMEDIFQALKLVPDRPQLNCCQLTGWILFV